MHKVLLGILALGLAYCTPSKRVLTGKSFNKSITIIASTPEDIEKLEQEYIAMYYPGYRVVGLGYYKHRGKYYNSLTISPDRRGRRKTTIFFDVTVTK